MKELYCDFNARLTDDCFSLERKGSLEDLERLDLTLEQADGVAFTFWSDDADSHGSPDDLLADGIVMRHEVLGWVARIDPTSFRHRSENRQQERTED